MSLRLFEAVFLCLHPILWAAAPATDTTLTVDLLDPARDRVVPLKVFQPASDAPSPVVLFSHGLGGSREGNAYLGNHWAAGGYVAVFLQHPGSDERVWRAAVPEKRLEALKKAANVGSALSRYADVSLVIDQLEIWNETEGHPLRGKLDLDRIGMSGHSFGAATTQGLMGQRNRLGLSFHEPRLTAFLLLSPSRSKGLTQAEAFGRIRAPVLLMTGTKDGSLIDPATTPESRMEVYAGLPDGDKYHLVFEDGEHSAFSDAGMGRPRIAHHHPAIQTISTRFWDAYLKEDPEAKQWLQSAEVRVGANLVEKDVWEWK